MTSEELNIESVKLLIRESISIDWDERRDAWVWQIGKAVNVDALGQLIYAVGQNQRPLHAGEGKALTMRQLAERMGVSANPVEGPVSVEAILGNIVRQRRALNETQTPPPAAEIPKAPAAARTGGPFAVWYVGGFGIAEDDRRFTGVLRRYRV